MHGGGLKVESSTEVSISYLSQTNRQRDVIYTIMTLISCEDDAISKQLYSLDYIIAI